MAKGAKLRLSFLSSLQICRPKNPTSSVKNPVPAVTYMLSSINSKSFDIPYPGYPNPPPSTPYQSKSRSNIGTSKIAPFESESQSKPCPMHGMIDEEYSSQVFSKTRREGKEKMYNSPISSDSEERVCPYATSRIEKRKEKTKKKKSIASINTTTTSVDSNEKDDEMTVPIVESKEKNTTSRRMVQEMTSGKVYQSFVVVKRSVDPFEDFKSSMLEMILDKQIFRPKELEELLMSFLSLNSRLHHEAIVGAFIEIWNEVFCGSWN